jgi:hypothetical protein
MSGSGDNRVEVVEIEVPKAVEERARERAGDDDLDEYLLDEYVFEYEWVFEGES